MGLGSMNNGLVSNLKENTINTKKLCYYAHPITDYDEQIEYQDMTQLLRMGFDVVNPNQRCIELEYKEKGMSVFLGMIDNCEAVAFRGFRDGTIPAGVAKEVEHGITHNKLIFELGSFSTTRVLSVERTRAKLKELGRK